MGGMSAMLGEVCDVEEFVATGIDDYGHGQGEWQVAVAGAPCRRYRAGAGRLQYGERERAVSDWAFVFAVDRAPTHLEQRLRYGGQVYELVGMMTARGRYGQAHHVEVVARVVQ